MDEGEEDAIYDAGYEEAVHAWGPAYCNRPPNPYDHDTPEAEIWHRGLMAGIASQHDY